MSRSRWILGGASFATVVCVVGFTTLLAQPPAGRQKSNPADKATATPIERIKAKKDFKVELLYSVPADKQGSWVSMTVDPKGRLIVSDQYGKLYRLTPPALGVQGELKIETIPVELGEAQGLLWAFDSLYVVVNRGSKYQTGLYRVKSSKGDDQLDQVEKLRALEGGGEHGPHAIMLSPDGKSLYIVAGNHTPLTPIDSSLVPKLWGEDFILPRQWDANGHATGILAPGGWICKTDPAGKNWQLVSIGYRNQYDAAFNQEGELFTYDSDMEWDINTPWYRPTRVCHAVPGSEFGWRSGTGVYPVYYPDNLPPVVNVGPGSPTGVAFGYGAKFPGKYQQALFLCDWSYGKLYACHLQPDGSSYKGELEEFLTGIPLPLTDLVVNPNDGALYFTIGGRKTMSGLYRVTYVGNESTAPVPIEKNGAEARAERRKLEAYYLKNDPKAIDAAWPYLGHSDRFLRYAARTILELQGPASWQEKALKESNPQAAFNALLALVRSGDKALQPQILTALDRFDWNKLNEPLKQELIRLYQLTFIKMGRPDESALTRTIARFDFVYPAATRELNSELCKLLVYLQAPTVASKTMDLLAKAPSQEEQMDLALSLRELKVGWSTQQRDDYFRWFHRAAYYRGGHSFVGFVNNIKKEAIANLPAEEKTRLKSILEAVPKIENPFANAKPRPFVKNYTVAELLPSVEKGLTGRDFEQGRRLFGETKCYACHRFNNEGGSTGPDLTIVSGRFGPRDLLESIIEPSKVVSDQYQAVAITTNDGRIVAGRIINLHGDTYNVNTDMLDPDKIVGVNRKNIASIDPSPISMMPSGLVDVLQQDEVLDLVAYLLSRGDRNHKMFQR